MLQSPSKDPTENPRILRCWMDHVTFTKKYWYTKKPPLFCVPYVCLGGCSGCSLFLTNFARFCTTSHKKKLEGKLDTSDIWIHLGSSWRLSPVPCLHHKLQYTLSKKILKILKWDASQSKNTIEYYSVQYIYIYTVHMYHESWWHPKKTVGL